MNKTIIGVIVGIMVFGGLVWIARPDSSQSNIAVSANSNGVLAVQEENNYDFGTISMAAGKVKHQFKIKNTSNEVVEIDKMYTSCMCTTAELVTKGGQFGPFGMPGHGAVPKIQAVIEPDEEVIVEAVFDPAAHGPAGVGRIQRSIVLENNVGEPIELQFSATVTP